MKLAGKTALVTGAGRGIGLGIAIELARAGATLLINDRPGSTDLANAQHEIQEFGGSCMSLEADAFTRDGCMQLVERAVAQLGRLDILVSNPAFGVRRSFLDYDPDDFDRVVRCTLNAGFYISQPVARHMVQQGGGGKILFISSVMAEMPFANSVAYSAAKLALNQMSRTMATELAEYRINVNVIEPGWIDTPGERIAFGEATIHDEAARLPWGRLGTPADIGRAAAFLVSEDAEYITGAVLPVDGGFRFKDCRSQQLIAPRQVP
ncbi:MAG: SDR family NAD(P)-dependent oxidoreductase [Pirellulaceae bacterium]